MINQHWVRQHAMAWDMLVQYMSNSNGATRLLLIRFNVATCHRPILHGDTVISIHKSSWYVLWIDCKWFRIHAYLGSVSSASLFAKSLFPIPNKNAIKIWKQVKSSPTLNADNPPDGLRSINPNTIKHFVKQSPILFQVKHVVCTRSNKDFVFVSSQMARLKELLKSDVSHLLAVCRYLWFRHIFNTAYRYRKSMTVIETYSIDNIPSNKNRIRLDNCSVPQVCRQKWVTIDKLTTRCLDQAFLNSYGVFHAILLWCCYPNAKPYFAYSFDGTVVFSYSLSRHKFAIHACAHLLDVVGIDRKGSHRCDSRKISVVSGE